jgi:glycosyltransferase involved in cell wall biosynthesis
VPVVVVAGPDNAAVELVDEGTNGFVAQSADPHGLADPILRIQAAGPELRASTADWFRRNAERLSFDSSFERVLEVYGEG